MFFAPNCQAFSFMRSQKTRRAMSVSMRSKPLAFLASIHRSGIGGIVARGQ